MNFKDTITALAAANGRGETFLSLVEAVAVANILSVEDRPLDLTTPTKVAAFARTLPAVREAYAEGKKIVAIKAVRDASTAPGTILPDTSAYARSGGKPCLGLKDAKDGIDNLWYYGLNA